MSDKDEKPVKGLGSRIVKAARDVAVNALRSAADKLEGPHAVFDADGVAIDLPIDLGRGTMWATQDQIAALYGRDKATVREHLKNLYENNELDQSAVEGKFPLTAADGKTCQVTHYSLSAVLKLGFKIHSPRAAAFREWAANTLGRYVVEGFALNEKRLREDPVALQSLTSRVRALRAEEKNLYAKVRECFMMSASDYDKESEEARRFFLTLQEKFTYAASEHTSAELVLARADHTKERMGLSTCSGARPVLKDVMIGKNYLLEHELEYLRLVSDAFLIFVESKAMKDKKLSMADLLKKMDEILVLHEMPVFPGWKPSNTRERADKHAKKQLELFNTRTGQERYAAARTIAPPA